MRKYFWQKDNITLTLDNDKYADKEPNEEEIFFTVLDKDNHRIGNAVINWINIRGGSAGIEVEIFEQYRRCGYGSTAMEVMLEYAFNEYRLHKINVCSKSNQKGAISFLHQLGFVFEAVRTNMFIIDGNSVAEYYYGMTETEYRSTHRKDKAHKQAPKNYATPIENTFGMLDKVQEYTPIEYISKDNFYFCDELKFRGMTISDNQENNKMLFDSQVCRWFDDYVKLPADTNKVSEYQKNHLNYKMDDDRIEFAFEENGVYAGCVNICGIDKENSRFFASIYVCPHFRGKGLGTKAMRFALAYSAKELDCHNFFVCVSNGNIASAKTMRKLGCKASGVQKEAAFVGGKYVDTLFFELTV